MIKRWVLGACALAWMSACASSAYELVGAARAPISAADVKIYMQAPPVFEEVAVLNAFSHSAFHPGGQHAIDQVMARLKEQAAKLGANGIILGEFSDAQSTALGTGLGTDTYTHNASISLGAGGSVGIFKKTGRGRAIYVPPG
jgi:hypothetical protein